MLDWAKETENFGKINFVNGFKWIIRDVIGFESLDGRMWLASEFEGKQLQVIKWK